MKPTTLTKAGLLAAVLLSGAALADGLPRLPGEKALPRGADSPGTVTFRHDSHVDGARPSCLGCHATRFAVLGESSPRKDPPLTHAAMEKGAACGACHGKEAFGFDDCTMCHAE